MFPFYMGFYVNQQGKKTTFKYFAVDRFEFILDNAAAVFESARVFVGICHRWWNQPVFVQFREFVLRFIVLYIFPVEELYFINISEQLISITKTIYFVNQGFQWSTNSSSYIASTGADFFVKTIVFNEKVVFNVK